MKNRFWYSFTFCIVIGLVSSQCLAQDQVSVTNKNIDIPDWMGPELQPFELLYDYDPSIKIPAFDSKITKK